VDTVEQAEELLPSWDLPVGIAPSLHEGLRRDGYALFDLAPDKEEQNTLLRFFGVRRDHFQQPPAVLRFTLMT
jgi:hypothetical protein